MRFLSKRRAALLCAGLGTVGAASAFTFGATSAQYTSTAAAQDNSITSGTVTLSEDAVSHAYSLTGFMPGDGSCSSPPAGAGYVCDKSPNLYSLSYSGSNPAFVGMDIDVKSTASQACTSGPVSATGLTPASVVATCTGLGQLPLFDGLAGAGDLDLSITPENGDTAHQLILDSSLVTGASCSTDASKVVTCESVIKNIEMPLGSGIGTSALQWVNGSHDTVHVDLGLPVTAGNQFQGSVVHIILQSHAVQWDNNNTTAGATPACAGDNTFPAGLGAVGTACPISWA